MRLANLKCFVLFCFNFLILSKNNMFGFIRPGYPAYKYLFFYFLIFEFSQLKNKLKDDLQKATQKKQKNWEKWLPLERGSE